VDSAYFMRAPLAPGARPQAHSCDSDKPPRVLVVNPDIVDSGDEYSDPKSDLDFSDGFDARDHSSLPHPVCTALAEASALTRPASGFQQLQTEITDVFRLVVIDWLFRVVVKVGLHRVTFANAVHLLDTVFSEVPIAKDQIQLVAVVCLWISTKVEETVPSSIEIFMAVCQGQFTAEAFRQKELEVVGLLGCRLDFSTAQFYLLPFLAEIDKTECQSQVQFWLDVSLYEYGFIELPAPLVVVASICSVLGEQCPFARLCAAAKLQRNVGVILDVMKKLSEVETFLMSRESSGLVAAHSMEEIHELSERMKQNIRVFSQFPE
jgi:hypothetical protein